MEYLQHYTDDELWAVVDQRLTQKQDTRLRELIALDKQGQQSADEQAEVERLVDLVDSPDAAPLGSTTAIAVAGA